eukprot:COSAG01_NODE_10064_length_2259_cov_1.231944_1_plen_204_part_10
MYDSPKIIISPVICRNTQKPPEILWVPCVYMEESVEEAISTPPPKAKRQLSEKQLTQLAKAREKANAVRKKNAEMKRKEKQVKEMQRKKQEQDLDAQLQRLVTSDEPASEPIPIPSKAPAVKKGRRVVQLQAEEGITSSSEEPTPPPKRTKKKKKKKVRIPSSSESSDEELSGGSRSYQQQQNVGYDPHMQRAFSSLFPNYNV